VIVVRPADTHDDAALASIDLATWTWDTSPAPVRPPGEAFFSGRTSPEDVLEAEAKGLYESCGFAVEGVLEDEFLLSGRLVDDVLMASKVGPELQL